MAVDLHEYPSMVAELTNSDFSDEQTRALVEFIGRVVTDSRSGIMKKLDGINGEVKELRTLIHKLVIAAIGGAFAICVALLGILGTLLLPS